MKSMYLNIINYCYKIVLVAVLFGSGLYLFFEHVVSPYRQYRVLRTPAAQLNYFGRHFIVGYEDFEKIKRLVSKGGVGGVYITRRNLAGKGAKEIKAHIRALQVIQRSLGLLPLWVAADQEGGIVSRLSPPLAKQSSLASVIRKCQTLAKLDDTVIQYAARQARGLSALGVNVNLSPVVDLKTEHTNCVRNGKSSIYYRAIAKDPQVVAKIAATYCQIMEDYGVIPTLKHFPGLGHVREETHLITGKLNTDIEYLEQNDWVPFRQAIRNTRAFIMLGHVKINAIDSAAPASFSEKVVQTIIRQKWRHDGILMTDDLNMGPAVNSAGGIGAAAVKALNAGVDLLLISHDPDQYYTAMNAVIRAARQKRLNMQRITASHQRLARRTHNQTGMF
jgi:beta-N-acetylhexosaminidase